MPKILSKIDYNCLDEIMNTKNQNYLILTKRNWILLHVILSPIFQLNVIGFQATFLYT